MLFVVLISFAKFINALDDAQSLIPVSVPIDAMKTNLDLTQNCNIDIKCAGDDLYNPKCGKTCFSTGSSEDYLEYTFSGVKFEIHGSTSQSNHNFEVLLDGQSLGTIDLSTLSNNVYTSNEMEYKSYTIKIKGIQDHHFGIHKIAFYPSLKAVRIDVKDLFSSKSWTEISDNIGGLTTYTNASGAFKSAVIECSKVWVYGSKGPTLGTLQVDFRGKSQEIIEKSTNSEELVLIYESESGEFGKYELSINRIQNRILIHSVYYLADGPEKTPEPPIQYDPDSADAYIGKTLDQLPNNRIIIDTNSEVNEISRSTFTNINSDAEYLIRIDKQIEFSDNTITYTDTSKTYPSAIHVNYKGTLTIQNCHFINARCTKEIGIRGNILFSDQQISVIFDTCEFIDCGNEAKEQLILQNDPLSSLKLINCNFKFNDMHSSCKVFYSKSSNINIDGCAFDKCGVESICMNCRSNVGDFSFTNNNVQNVIEQFILINFLKTPITFSGNVFHDIHIEGGYFITINHDQRQIDITNNTFINIESGNGSVYGGGLSLWFARDEMKEYTLNFVDCKFYDITNNNGLAPYNQGGAIQYGFSSSISNASMLFQNCDFKRNKCIGTNSAGGAIAVNINHDLIVSDCIFEGNQAKTYAGCIHVSGQIIDSITGDPQDCAMEKIVLTNCQFTGNTAIVGSVFNTLSYNINHVKLLVDSCSLIDNVGARPNSFPLSCECGEVIFVNTTIKNEDPKKYFGLFSFNSINIANLTNCTFINGWSKDGSIKFNNQLETSRTIIDRCNFINCVYPGHHFINLKGYSEITSTKFINDDIEEVFGAIDFGSNKITLSDCVFTKTNSLSAIHFDQTTTYSCSITGCTFDGCAGQNSCFDLNFNTFDITFKNNIIQNSEKSGSSGYIGSIISKRQINTGTFLFDNISFINNKCDSLYGGGTGLWVQNYEQIKFNNCKFIDNEAYKSNDQRERPIGDKEYYSGDGGAIQFGYTELIFKTNILFDNCEFTGNKAVRHGGALALQSVGNVEIIHCTFENNVGNYKPSSSKLLDFTNYYSKKKEGRGGAIYLNPAFQHANSDPNLYTSQLSITDCTFKNNVAFNGHAIYIEGDDPGTVFTIRDNKFIDNYDKNNPSEYSCVIMTEIYKLYESDTNTTNTYTNTDQSISSIPVLYVLHNGLPITPPITDDPNDVDELEIINATSKGRNEFIINDFSRTLVIVMISKFIDITSRNDGGAIHIQNAGLICNETLFENCSSLEGAGGAVYLTNTYNSTNIVTLIQDNVHLCEAQYGGGFYIYSTNWNNRVIIKQCTFTENKVHAEIAEGKKYGGSGVYVTSRKGTIKQNTFIDNEGPGSTLKKDNRFDEDVASASLKILDEDPFIISNCHFKILGNSDSAVFYVKGKNGNFVELSDCTFEGNLAKGGHYIDGVSISDNTPKMLIKNCKFLSSENDSYNPLSDALTTDPNDGFINSIGRKKRADSKKSAFIVVAVTGTITFSIISIMIFITVKKKNSNFLADDEML